MAHPLLARRVDREPEVLRFLSRNFGDYPFSPEDGGMFKDKHPVELGSLVLREVVKRAGVKPD